MSATPPSPRFGLLCSLINLYHTVGHASLQFLTVRERFSSFAANITTPNIVSSVSLILQGNSAVSQQKNPRSQEQRFIVDLIILFH